VRKIRVRCATSIMGVPKEAHIGAQIEPSVE
jgi:hypothetical protein